MTKHIIGMTICAVLFGAAIGFMLGVISAQKTIYSVQDTYCDGEGNVIPNGAIHLLVTSQFVNIAPEEKKELSRYFYTTK